MKSGEAGSPPEPLRIVAIGGGTGLSTLLHGLKQLVHCGKQTGSARLDITAIVTVTDDGGSSGRLRRDFDVLPPGDIRNCMVALSEDEALLSRLFQYRFSSGRGLKGHSFGNLFLTALTHLTGDFAKAVQLSNEVLASCGRIYPATASNVRLEAELIDGRIVAGESKISKSRSRIAAVRLVPGDCTPLPETLAAIARADLITLGPGSLFTSVLPNLLVHGIPEAIEASPAAKVYFVNLMSQPGETTGFTASQHVDAVQRHAGRRLLDYAVVNTVPITPEIRRRYAAERATPVENDMNEFDRLEVEVLPAPLAAQSNLARHDSAAAAQLIVDLAASHRAKRTPKVVA